MSECQGPQTTKQSFMLSKDKSPTDTKKPKKFTVGIILIMVLLSFCFFCRCVLVYQSINRSFICHLDTNILHLQHISRRPMQAQLSFSREVPFNLGTNHQKSDWGGGEKSKKKFMQGKMQVKKKVKKKIHAEGRSNCDVFRKSEFQKSTILPGTI